ncbi:hypothetical protein COHA_002047 [Chlorella ohadii]|uniref:CBM20 domain-containing protein n=1 Tax=Chlorella ohadii TaxID=2649997 RepID=A0AAD5H4T8_9CHLO|nr:hypothetical protein COHA_002047 [Chlorella ohadii]
MQLVGNPADPSATPWTRRAAAAALRHSAERAPMCSSAGELLPKRSLGCAPLLQPQPCTHNCRAFKGDGGDEPTAKRQPAEQQQAARAAGGAAASVTFKASHRVAFGQVLKVVGSGPQLGDWDCDKAPAMQWSEGDQWLLSLDLPAGSHEFKLVTVAPPAREGARPYADWEAGANRTLKVPAVEASAHGAFTVVCEWGNTSSSMETLPSEELEEEEEEGPLSGEAPVGVIGKMTMERPEEPQQPPAAASATEHQAGQVGGVSVPAEAATADRSAATGQAEKATAGGKDAALRAVFGWARRHDSEDEGEDGEGGKAPAPPPPAAPAPAPAPAAQKKGSGQEKGKKGAAAGKKNKAGKAGSSEPAAAAEGDASTSARAGSEDGGSPKAAGGMSGDAAKPSKEEPTAAKPAAGGQEEGAAAKPAGGGKEEGAAAKPAAGGQEEGAAAKPASAGQAGGSSGAGGSGASREEPNPHAPVGMKAGDYPSQTPMGERSDDPLSGVPAGGLKPSTEASVKEQMRKEALTGSQQSDDEGEGGGGPPGGGSSGGGSAKGAEGGSQAQQQRGEQGPGSASSAATAMQEPPSGMQLAIAAAGLAALPVVAWSEWVLKSTGCGLPPGPSGLLGAAEGVSYLVVGGVVLWSLATKLSTGRGLPAGPGGALGAVEGGSWLAALSGVVVLALQWQTYGYIPSALPDSNCFGQPAGFATAQASGAPTAAASLAAAPALNGIDSSKASAAYGGPMRLAAGRSSSLPQGNLLFSLETALSQSGGIVQGAETAAAAVAAAAAGQPPPAQVAAAVQELKSRALQAQQLVAALSSRAVGLGGEAGTDSALQAATAEVAASQTAPPPAAEPLGFQPPRHRVRAALSASVDRMLHSEKLRAVLEPVPLPAVARQAAQAAGGALSAVDAAAKEAVELSLEAVQREEQLAAAWSKRAVGGAISKAQTEADQLTGAAVEAQSRLESWLPPLRAQQQQQQQ